MNIDPNNPLVQAELEVQKSDQKLEKAFDHLKGSLEGNRTANLLIKAIQDPILLSASAFLIGIYLGETLRSPRVEKKLSLS